MERNSIIFSHDCRSNSCKYEQFKQINCKISSSINAQHASFNVVKQYRDEIKILKKAELLSTHVEDRQKLLS